MKLSEYITETKILFEKINKQINNIKEDVIETDIPPYKNKCCKCDRISSTRINGIYYCWFHQNN